MAYAPVNVDAYTNAYSGALAGMAISGWIIDPNAADYSEVAAIAGAFAQAFDIVWNSATALNWLQIQSIQSVCQEQFTGHSPGSLDNSSFALAATWAVPAAACAALVLQGDAFVNSEGITPNTPSGSSSSALTAVWFVDSGTLTPLVDQNGKIGSPFATFAQAVAAVAADRVANPANINQVIWFTSPTNLNYSGEADQVLDLLVGLATLTLASWTTFMAGVPPAPANVPLLPGLTLTTGDLILEGVCLGFAGLVDAPSSVVSMRGAMINSGLNAASLRATNGCQVGGLVQVANTCELEDTLIAGGGITCPNVRFRNCNQNAACLVTGTAIVDGYTNAWQTITSTVSVIVAEQLARETLSIVVPAVLAGQVGYVSTAFVGELAALPSGSPLVGNPQADLVAAGAGGGFINCWADAAGSVRCSFIGPLAGGAVNFTFATL